MPKYRKPCYYCGNPSTSREHAPAEMFFRGFPCDSITAPSCETHNNSKSDDDQSFVSALIQSLNNIKTERNEKRPPEIEKAIAVAKSSFELTKKHVTSVDIIEKEFPGDTKLPKVIHFQGKINDWIKQLTAVLVWDATKHFDEVIDWNKATVRSPNLSSSRYLEQISESGNVAQKVSELGKKLAWIDGWSAHPKPYPASIYSFWLLFDYAESSVIVKHRFYNSYSWYVMFSASVSTIDAMQKQASEYKKNILKA